MPDQVTIGDKIIRIGDMLRSNRNAADNGICNPDMTFTVRAIKDDGELVVGLYSSTRISRWNTLDGRVPNKHGFWASRDCILDNFDLIRDDHVISGEESFRGVDLKGEKCKVLHVNRKSSIAFVELAKDVGAGSADGLGKQGHCVVVRTDSLTKRKQDKKAFVKWLEGE